MSRVRAIVQHGQSIWMDYIRRSFLESGEFERWIELGVTGITSNPTILEQAVIHSTDYEAALQRLAASGARVQEAYESLAIADIQMASDLLRATYDQSGGKDGFASLEVNPHLSMDADATVAEAHRLFEQIDRPNAMIKVPATPAGCRALEALLRRGINVNVTLIFCVSQYAHVLEAFQRGLESRIERGESVSTLASVASFFVSRIDSAIDPQLKRLRATELLGQTAIASATLAYEMFDQMLSSPRWQALAEAGASPQRPLWASTSTKNPDYPDTLYVDSLIAPSTVNTIPLNTLHAVLDHGRVDRTLFPDADGARNILRRLGQLNIDLETVTDELLAQGLGKFEASFDALADRLGKQLDRLREPDPAAI
ncbi:transaldolase [Candidatus Bipolaricaulota bacterium]|nr:transaldolase [Candidatus Bipolaricaulota bacterium]